MTVDDWKDDLRFVGVIEEVMESEGPNGEISNDPRDPGRLTKYGISQRAYPDVDIRNLTKDGAKAIYYRDWWVARRYQEIEDPELAGELLDLGITNPTAIHEALQRAIPKTGGQFVNVDGGLGNYTISAANEHPNKAWLLDRFRLEVIKFYRGLNRSHFLASWVARSLT